MQFQRLGSFVACCFLTISAAVAADPVMATMETSMGTIKLELYPDKAPATVDNFIKYAESGFYEDTIFHRVMRGFMIQGGGLTKELREKETRPPIPNEASNGLKNDRYTIAMARTPDPNSATSQFFINHADNQNLNRPNPDGFGYAVFGKVVEGEDVVEKIAKAKTKVVVPRMHENVPVEPIVIEKVTIEKDK